MRGHFFNVTPFAVNGDPPKNYHLRDPTPFQSPFLTKAIRDPLGKVHLKRPTCNTGDKIEPKPKPKPYCDKTTITG